MEMTITRPDGSAVAVPLEFAAGLSQPVALPGSGITVRVGESAPAGAAWVVSAAAAPEADLGALAARVAALGADVLLPLFGAAPEEPYLTWRNLWESDRPLPYRLGAVLLALAARTDEARRAER